MQSILSSVDKKRNNIAQIDDNNDDENEILFTGVENAKLFNDENREDGDQEEVEAIFELEPDLGDPSSPLPAENVKSAITQIINGLLKDENIYLHKIAWLSGRLEVVLSQSNSTDSPIGSFPLSQILYKSHRITLYPL
jgi:hypothetical protein